MRRTILALAVLAAMAVSYGLGRHYTQSQTGSKTGGACCTMWTPCIPPINRTARHRSDCGMQLEPVYAEAAGNAASSSPLAALPAGAVGIDGATQRLLGIRLADVRRAGPRASSGL